MPLCAHATYGLRTHSTHMQLMQVESSSSLSDHADLECGTRAEQRECGIGVGGYLPHSKIEGESEAVSDVTVPGTALLQRENDHNLHV